MGGNAAAEAAPWQVVRLRAMLCAAEAHSSAVGHRPAWRLTVYLSESVGVYAGRPGREVMAPPRGIEPRPQTSMLAGGAQLAGNSPLRSVGIFRWYNLSER